MIRAPRRCRSVMLGQGATIPILDKDRQMLSQAWVEHSFYINALFPPSHQIA